MTGHILVVDDDDSTRTAVALSLERLGCRVMTAGDGSEVADLVAAQRFDLIVLDLYMPGMNGFEVLRRIRNDPDLLPRPRTPRDVSVLVLSGESNPASIANAKGRGANAYLVKPVDGETLETTVRKLMRKR